MPIQNGRDYTIRNKDGFEVDVTAEILRQRALSKEPDVVLEGGREIPLGAFVHQNVQRQDVIAEAHEQGVDLPPVAPASGSEEIKIVRDLEFDLSVATALEREEKKADQGANTEAYKQFAAEQDEDAE